MEDDNEDVNKNEGNTDEYMTGLGDSESNVSAQRDQTSPECLVQKIVQRLELSSQASDQPLQLKVTDTHRI